MQIVFAPERDCLKAEPGLRNCLQTPNVIFLYNMSLMAYCDEFWVRKITDTQDWFKIKEPPPPRNKKSTE